jgi:hypothetical protein
MNGSFTKYQIIHEAILRSTRECHKHCHQNSEHDNRNETSHIASTHALKVVNNIVAVCCSFISKQKRLDNTARPKLLRTPCWRRYFFTATNGSSHIASNHLMHHTQRHVQLHFKQKHILPARNLNDGHENSVASSRVTSSRCLAGMRATYSTKKVVYQNMDKTSSNSDSKESGLSKT